MARLQLRSLAAVVPWFGLVLGACDPTPPRDGARPEDSGTKDAALDGGAGADAAEPMTSAGTGAPPWTIPPFPTEGKYCALAVGAPCDGPEDCSDGEFCCAEFNPVAVTYENIGCARSCRGTMRFEVCHADGDDEPDCTEPGYVCRPSLIARFDFFDVCAPRLDLGGPSKNRGAPGLIACGDRGECEVGSEQCCLRASFDFARSTVSFLEPYCAPLADGKAACGCDVVPPPRGGDPKDAGVDASIDASQPDPGDDDAG